VDHFSVWLFNYGSQCTRAQYWSRALTHQHFSNTPHGVPGNEDYGAMSSWLLFASLGLFPRAGTTDFLLGSPRVQQAALQVKHLDGSSSLLEIVTVDNSAENVYVSSLLVNGLEHRSTVIDRAVLMDPAGCRLEFTMTAVPESGLC
jgi:putative alpha-1,2-mannosidase